MNTNTEMTSQTRIFSNAEIRLAANMLKILAYISCDYWTQALTSNHFVSGGKLLDYERGYKDRVQKIIANPQAKPIDMEQITIFRTQFHSLADIEISKYIDNDKYVAILLGRPEMVQFAPYESVLDFDFWGWDNDPCGILAEAMKFAKINGKLDINSKYRKTRITLKDDGSIREGWRKWSPILYQVR